MVSVLIPVYNVELFLPQCLDSVVNQTYADLQIVMIDDGSTDNSFNICKQFAEKDSRIEVYHQENQGVAATRNHLLEKVKGDYVLFVDSDDWIEPDMIKALFQLALEYDADIVNCQNVNNDALCKKDSAEIEVWSQEETVRHFLCHQVFNGSLWNKLIRTTLLHELKFHQDISYGEDALFCWHVLQKVQKMVKTSQQYYHYRMNDNSLSHKQFGAKHMSGHLVWKQISEETASLWPQYRELASATYAISDMWQLYYAAKSNYNKDEHILEFQTHVRNNINLIRKSKLISAKKLFFAIVISLNYRLGVFLIK